MRKKIKNFLGLYKEYGKMTLAVYVILRMIIVIIMIRQIFQGNIENALLCIFSLLLFLLPIVIQKKFQIDMPSTLEIMILLFIFASEILGEINNFYQLFSNFDTILHTINGFLCAAIGFSLVYLLNENIESFNLSPVFVALVAFCFSMMIGVVWEFFEFGMDTFFKTDMQRDTIIYNLNSVDIETKSKKENQVANIKDINKTILLSKNGSVLAHTDGYLDIGLIDTMEDLFVNFVGATIYSLFGFLYIINKEKFKFVEAFLTKKKKPKLAKLEE